MKNMKILIIEPCFLYYGGYNRSFPMGLALSKKNVQVDYLVSTDKNFQLTVKKKIINDKFTQYDLPRFNFHSYLNGRILRALIGLWKGLWGNYDIIFARVPTQFESNIPAFFLKLFGKKIVIDWDDYWIGSPIFNGHNILKKYLFFCERRAPKFFGNYVAISGFLEKKAKDWGAKKVLKMINGVTINEFKNKDKEESYRKLKLDPSKKYLIFIGNTCSRSRTYLLFSFLEKILKLNQDVRLICNFNLKKKIREQRLGGRISQEVIRNTLDMGYLSHEQLEYCFSICTAALFFQGKTEDEMACYPVRIGSYLSAECPIIMNDIGSEAAEVAKKFEYSVIENDISVLAEKTSIFLEDEDYQKRIKENMSSAKEALSWDNITNDLLNFFIEIMKNVVAK